MFPQENLLPEKTKTVFTFQFLTNKIDQNTNFDKFPSAKWPFLHSKIEKEKCNLSQFSLVTGFFEGMRENILKIFWALAT